MVKKQKACLNCRRAKLRCKVVEGEECERCIAKGEKCKFKLRSHDEQTETETRLRLENLERTMGWLLESVAIIGNHLQLDLPAPPVPLLSLDNEDELIASPIQGPPVAAAPPPPPLKRLKRSAPDSRQEAEVLLARSVIHNSPAQLYTPLASTSAEPEAPRAIGFFGLLDDLVASPAAKGSTHVASPIRPMRRNPTMVVSSNGVGSADPRIDIVKAGIVPQDVAEVLVTFFHSHLAPHLLGFPFIDHAFPFLREGPRTMTPLVFGVVVLVAALRLPQYRYLVPDLESFLAESVLNVEPGNYFVATETAGGSEKKGEEPDLDLELGIGPEEILGVCIYAMFGFSQRENRSHIIAQTAFEWTRGYLKTYMLPIPPPLTYGEAFGLLPTRRDLSYEDWLRLWLFAYVVDSQQAFLHEQATLTAFDPLYYCDALASDRSQIISPEERARDVELIAQARVYALLQKVQHARESSGWNASSIRQLIARFDGWNAELDDWYSIAFPHLSRSSSHQSVAPPSPSSELSLNLIGLFSRIFINLAGSKELELHSLAGSKEDALESQPRRWVYVTASAGSARDLLRVSLSIDLPLLLPFYVKMVSLAAVVLLGSLEFADSAPLPESPRTACELVRDVAGSLARSAVPQSEVSSRLLALVEKTRRNYVD